MYTLLPWTTSTEMLTLSPGKVCVSITHEKGEEALAAAQEMERFADVIEIRLDCLKEPKPESFLDHLEVPLLFTNRAAWEGGGWKGDEEERLAMLARSAQAGAAFVDVEVKTRERLRSPLIDTAHDHGCLVICSWHDFDATPAEPELLKILDQQRQSGADIGKIVTLARSPADVTRMLSLLPRAEEEGFPLIAFCMGTPGVISRVATLMLGGFMTYAAPDHSRRAAPGQIPVKDLRAILELLHGH